MNGLSVLFKIHCGGLRIVILRRHKRADALLDLLKNLVRGDTQTVHLVAFTPAPRLIRLQLAPTGGEQRILNGQRAEAMVSYALKPQLGALAGTVARLLNKTPPDSHVWIVTHEVPAFVRFEGPLYLGPVWRMDLTTPRWPR